MVDAYDTHNKLLWSCRFLCHSGKIRRGLILSGVKSRGWERTQVQHWPTDLGLARGGGGGLPLMAKDTRRPWSKIELVAELTILGGDCIGVR